MNIIEIIQEKNFWKSIFITILFFGTGLIFLFLHLSDYGIAFFIILPFIVGILIGSLSKYKYAELGALITLLIIIIFLYIFNYEGLLCILFALPLIILMLYLGILINEYLNKKGIFKPRQNIKFLITPLVIWICLAHLENTLIASKININEVRSEVILPFSNIDVYDAIKSVDTLIAEKGILMHLELPIPNKCILEKEEIGAKRTCYFNGGKIVEQISEIKKGKLLKMDVINYELTGRKWLGFKEAIYIFDSLGVDMCKLIRITTYTSELQPRIYWKPLEIMAIKEEHDYVFANLIKDLQRQDGR